MKRSFSVSSKPEIIESMSQKILFVSGSVSNRIQCALFDKYHLSTGFAIQKYYKLLEDGFARNGAEIDALSIVPIPKVLAPFRVKCFPKEKERNVNFRYVPYFRFAPFYHPFMLLYVMWRVFVWSIRHRRDGIVLCDVLIPCLCIGAAWGGALAGIPRVAWVTDMPGMSASGSNHYEEMGLLGKLQMRCIRRFSAYVFSTEACSTILNPNHNPYIIMEGLVDPEIKPHKEEFQNTTRDILYCGGLEEAYGLGYLCEAFMRLEEPDLRLIIYGDGPFKGKIQEYAKADSRIDFPGVAQNATIVEAERRATILVNPRFSGAEYTLYTFPSKNIEYMVSGTPMLTTKLPRIPADYYPFIFTFDDETVDGYTLTLRRILRYSAEELRAFGASAQQFVLKNKNAEVQVKRLMKLMNNTR